MDRIGGYGMYQKSYYESTVSGKKETEKTKAAKNGKADKKQQVQLSDRAKELLKQLQKAYKNMDFIVSDYENDEEASELLSKGQKEYSVLLDPETLEEMAADDKTREKYEGLIDEATGKLDEAKKQLGEEGKEVKSLGVSIGKDGSLTYFAELEKMGEAQKERIEAARAEKKEAAKKAQKEANKPQQQNVGRKSPWKDAAPETVKRTFVEADSIEGLMKKVKDVDWDSVPQKDAWGSGNRFDYSI